jgi:hypothetical protein
MTLCTTATFASTHTSFPFTHPSQTCNAPAYHTLVATSGEASGTTKDAGEPA